MYMLLCRVMYPIIGSPLVAFTVKEVVYVVGVPHSTSVSVFAVTVAAIWSPTITVRALLPSCARVMVNVSVLMAVTLTTSALVLRGWVLAGHTVALKGTGGKSAPCAAVTTRLVPLVAGEGAVATALYAKFKWLSAMLAYAKG